MEEPVGLDCSPTSGSVGGGSTGTLGQGLMHNLCYQLPCLQVTLAFFLTCSHIPILTYFITDFYFANI